MTYRAAILQSNYIPWKGYFDLISSVDKFVVYDEMQYTKRDWRNRNKIKTPNGLVWLSIPVEVKGKFDQKISETRISAKGWSKLHWNTIKMAYGKAPFFKDYKEIFENLYLEKLLTLELLSHINLTLIRAICEILKIETEILIDKDLGTFEGKNERLISICKVVQANTYLSGPAAKDYLDIAIFKAEQIAVEWMDYSSYPEYPQLYPPFEHAISILDLIFNTGKDARNFIKQS